MLALRVLPGQKLWKTREHYPSWFIERFAMAGERKSQKTHSPRLSLPASTVELPYLMVAIMAFGRQSCFYPALLSFRVIADIGVSHGRQFTGGVF